jgi:hypothetical protein
MLCDGGIRILSSAKFARDINVLRERVRLSVLTVTLTLGGGGDKNLSSTKFCAPTKVFARVREMPVLALVLMVCDGGTRTHRVHNLRDHSRFVRCRS